jgi:hypothetical protein
MAPDEGSPHNERRVDRLNMDTAILHGLDRIGDLDQLPGGSVGVGKGVVGGQAASSLRILG